MSLSGEEVVRAGRVGKTEKLMLFLSLFFYSCGSEGMIVQSHAVSGMSTRKELANPFPRCKKQRKTKSPVSSGVCLRKKGGLRVCLGRMTETKRNLRKLLDAFT